MIFKYPRTPHLAGSGIQPGDEPAVHDFSHLDGRQIELIQSLKDCPQNPEHHGEGDVWTHTQMVLAELELAGLSAEDREVLELAALLHDVAKPLCLQPDLSCPGHARKGPRWPASCSISTTSPGSGGKRCAIWYAITWSPIVWWTPPTGSANCWPLA